MKITELQEILLSFSTKRIAVIGDLMLDEYIVGDVNRVSPEAPVPVVNVYSEKLILGGAANVIANLNSMGTKVYPYSVIGNDENGKKLKKELDEICVSLDGIIETRERPTIVKKRILAGHQQLLRMDWEKKHDINEVQENSLLAKIKKNIDNLDAIILSDYAKGVLTKKLIRRIIELAREKGKIVAVDPKPSNVKNYVGATFLTPNVKEALESLSIKELYVKDEVLKNVGFQLKNDLELDHLVMTRSEKGIAIFEEETMLAIPTFAKEVYDVTGAGDTVISIYTLCLTAGLSYEIAAKIANTAAGIVVGKLGTATTSILEIIDFYDEIYHEFNNK